MHTIIDLLFNVMIFLIFARVLISWLPHNSENTLFRLLYTITDPVLKPFQFARLGMFDLSPIIVLLILNVLRMLVLSFL